jgi:hypothetical protein
VIGWTYCARMGILVDILIATCESGYMQRGTSDH